MKGDRKRSDTDQTDSLPRSTNPPVTVNEVRDVFNFESGMESLSVSVPGAPVRAVLNWGKGVDGAEGIGIEGDEATIA